MRFVIALLALVALNSPIALAQYGGEAKSPRAKTKKVKVEKAHTDEDSSRSESEAVTLTGHLIDTHCARHADNVDEAAEGMGKSCLLSPACLKSGLGLVADGTWYTFDANGTALAEKVVRKSKDTKGLFVEVKGTVDCDALTVSSVVEVKPAR